MERPDTRDPRLFVVAGFVLLATGAIINLVHQSTGGYFNDTSFSWASEAVLSPLTSVAALWAWWWLTQVTVSGAQQAKVMRRGLYGLALQYLCYFALMVAMLTSVSAPSRNWSNLAQWWVQGLGAALTCGGFFVSARNLRPYLETDDEFE